MKRSVVSIGVAKLTEARGICAVRNAAAEELTRVFGTGHWSGTTKVEGIERTIPSGRVIVAREGARVVGTFTLQTKKPWAIDVAYFTSVAKPFYLVDMAVMPSRQRAGIGRRLIEYATSFARESGAGAIRLDAYDADAGAGGFYAACGFSEVGRVTYRGNPLIYYEQVLKEAR